MAEEEAVSPELLEELEERRSLLVEEEEVEAHSQEVVEVVVGLPFLVMEEEEEGRCSGSVSKQSVSVGNGY